MRIPRCALIDVPKQSQLNREIRFNWLTGLDISKPLFEPSTITNDGHSTEHNTLVRDSEVALLPRTSTVRCIEARARSFQGWRDDLWIERLRTQRYGLNQHVSLASSIQSSV